MLVTDWILDKFSWTKLKCYAYCPRKAFLTYIVKRKEPPSPFLIIGRAVHEGQEFDALSKIRGEKLSVMEVLDYAVTSLKEEKENTGIEIPIDPFVEEHRTQLEVFSRTGERDKINPVPGTVEAQFQLELKVGEPDKEMKPALVEGFTDVVSQDAYSGERCAVDYKNVGRPVSAREVESNLQLALAAVGTESPWWKIVSFVRYGKQKPTTKVTKLVPLTQGVFERTLRFLADKIFEFRESYKSGNWPKAAPDEPYCQVCQFRELCYPEREPELSKWITVEKILPAGTLPAAEWRESKAARNERERSANASIA